MNEQKDEKEELDILESIEFDLTEAIKDLIYNLKTIQNDLKVIKKYLNL